MIFRNISLFLAICAYIAMLICIEGQVSALGWMFFGGFVFFTVCAGYCHVEEL